MNEATRTRRQRIIKGYEHFLTIPNDEPASRRVAELLGYTLDKNNNNAYVLKVIHKHKNDNK